MTRSDAELDEALSGWGDATRKAASGFRVDWNQLSTRAESASRYTFGGALRSWRHRTAFAAVATVAMVLVLALTLVGLTHNHVAAPAQGDTSSSTGEIANPTSFATVPGHVAVYVQLPASQVPADGRSLTIPIVLVNGLGKPFIVRGACNGWIVGGLRNSSAFSGFPLNGGVACAGLTIPTGQTRVTVTVSTAYNGCSADPNARGTSSMPRCEETSGHPAMPTLPPGVYHFVLSMPDVPDPVIRGDTTITLTTP